MYRKLIAVMASHPPVHAIDENKQEARNKAATQVRIFENDNIKPYNFMFQQWDNGIKNNKIELYPCILVKLVKPKSSSMFSLKEIRRFSL